MVREIPLRTILMQKLKSCWPRVHTSCMGTSLTMSTVLKVASVHSSIDTSAVG